MLLAVDTSSQLIGVALYDGAAVLSEMSWYSPNYHTVQLAPMVAEILERSGVEVGDIKALAVALGPGSFTGLRVGISFTKGLALAGHIPMIGIPTLDVLAAAQPVCPETQYRMAVVLQAGRGRLAVGWYQLERVDTHSRKRHTLETEPAWHWRVCGEPELLTPAELAGRLQTELQEPVEEQPAKPVWICGELDREMRILLEPAAVLSTPAQSLRRPSYLAELAWQRWQADRVDDPATLTPIYLRTGQSFSVEEQGGVRL